MSTTERACLQIFERKNRIINQVKQQILLFDHQLASKCLIDGFAPPPWLLPSSPSELNKEDVISGLLFPHSQPVVTTDNVQLSRELCSRVDASNEGLDTLVSGKGTYELDPSVTSPPPYFSYEMASDVCPDPCLSLARIQRSKSRQLALEHRNSAKACKNIESCEKNGGAWNIQDKVSEIASLQSGPVDKSELIRSGDSVVCYKVEKEERGQCRSKERTRSSYVQPSKSTTSPSGVANTSCVANQDGVAPTESICKSGQHHLVSHELLESEFVEPVDNTESCVGKNEDRGQCWSQERGEDIVLGGITRSRSSVHPSNVGKSFCVATQDGILLTESINKSGLKPDAAEVLLQFVEPVDNVVTCILGKEERDQDQSKERDVSIYSCRVKRSRNSAQSPESVNGLSCAGKTSEVAKCDDSMLIESISGSKEQLSVVGKLSALVKPSVISDETDGLWKARDHQSKEKGSNVSQGRLTRSRSSSQHYNFVNEHLKLDSCPDRISNEGICKLMQVPCHVNDLNELTKPFDITNEGCGIKAKTSDNQTMENAVVDQYNNGSIGSRANHSAKLFELDSSNILQIKVTQSKSTASNQFLCAKSSERSEGVGLRELSGTQVDSFPCIAGSDLAELNQCDAFVAETDADSNELVEASASSASNLGGGNNPSLMKSLNRYDRVELEVIAKSPQSSSAMKVLPKQLDFDDLGECTVKEASSLILKREKAINSLEKSSLTPLPCADNLDEVTSVYYQEKYDSSHEKHLPEEQEAFSKQEILSETAFSKTFGSRTSNLNVPSFVKDTPEVCTDAVTSSVPESNEISEQKTFMEDLSTTFEVSYEALPVNALQDVTGSNIDVDSGIDHLFEKDCGKVEIVKSVMLDPEASTPNLNTDLCSGPPICSPRLSIVAYATSNEAVGHPSAALSEETKGHSLKEKRESSPFQHNEVAMGRGIAGDIDSVLDQTHAKSSEKKVAVQSIRPGKHSRAHVEGSWPHKRRKIDSQQSYSMSLSLRSKEEDDKLYNAEFLIDEEQNGGKYNKKDRGSSQSTPSTCKQIDVASVSSFPLETFETFDHSVDGTGAVDPSSIKFGSTRKCTADENQIILNVGDRSEFANPEHLACDVRSNKGSDCHLGEGEFSNSFVISPCLPPTDLISVDQSRPELEGFIIETDGEQICNGGEGISLENLHLPNTTTECASLLEQLCKSASINTSLPQYPTTYRLHQSTGLYQSVPNGILECMNPRSTLPENDDSHLKVRSICFGEEIEGANDLYQSVPNGFLECMNLGSTFPENDDRKSHFKISSSGFGEEKNRAFLGGCFSDSLPLSSSRLTGNVKNPYLSPVAKFWDRITSHSDSSEKRGSLKLELPCINEENENGEEVVDAFQEGIALETVTYSAKGEPLAEVRECQYAPSSVAGSEIFNARDSLDSVNTDYSFIGTENSTKQKVGKHNAKIRRNTNKLRENCSMVPGSTTSKRASESHHNRSSKPKLSERAIPRNGGPSFSQKKSKLNNIISNVTSFIPIVQQKQAASNAPGKRDVKVKALEVAEAAKKFAEQKENDRRMKKEALKLERARLELENLRQLELEKKRKEEERKKKEANMAAKKRQREEEERLEKERKRKRMEEARRHRCAPDEVLRSKKDDREKMCQALDESVRTMKVPNGETSKHEKMQKEVSGANGGKMSAMEFSTALASTPDAGKTSKASEDFNPKSLTWTLNLCQVMSTLDRVNETDNQVAVTNIEESYDISPYKESDDEEDDDNNENKPNRKFVPSWVSKNRVALAIASQQNVDPEAIFLPKSFCSISQVLLPRKLQQNRAS